MPATSDNALPSSLPEPQAQAQSEPSNDNVTPPPRPTEADLTRLILAATRGDDLAIAVLEPAVLAIARTSLVYADDAERATQRVLRRLAMRRLGPPPAGRATAFLEAVVRYYAGLDFERTARDQREQWEGADRPPPDPED